jgi:predicted RNA-binding protein Jag
MSADIMGGNAQADMSDSTRRFFSGDTLQQALVQAANHYHLQPEEIAYHQIEKRHGFTKVRRKVVIEVDPAAPRRDPNASPPQPVAAARAASPAPPRPPRQAPPAETAAADGQRPAGRARAGGAGGGGERTARGPGSRPGARAAGTGESARGGPGSDRGRMRRPSGAYPRERRTGNVAGGNTARVSHPGEDLVALPERPRSVAERYPEAQGPQAEAAAKGVELLLRIAGLSLTPRIFQGDERLEIDLSGADTDWCFADDGELLMAIEHLLPRIIRSLSGEGVLCRVDCDNFHEIREERLRSLAQRVADEVRQRGRPRTLVPMNPADRRIIHVTLADDPAVVTESEGDGYFKRITVRPA